MIFIQLETHWQCVLHAPSIILLDLIVSKYMVKNIHVKDYHVIFSILILGLNIILRTQF